MIDVGCFIMFIDFIGVIDWIYIGMHFKLVTFVAPIRAYSEIFMIGVITIFISSHFTDLHLNNEAVF